MKKAFTLIELVVSIGILSIIMIFLYTSYASINKYNKFYEKEDIQIKREQLKKKVIFLDFSLAMKNSITILRQNKKTDIVFLQSSNSIHNRYNPYIAYILKENKLYRLESLKKFKGYPISADAEFSVECFGETESFRVYKSNHKEESYLVHIDFKNDKDILLKVNLLGA